MNASVATCLKTDKKLVDVHDLENWDDPCTCEGCRRFAALNIQWSLKSGAADFEQFALILSRSILKRDS